MFCQPPWQVDGKLMVAGVLQTQTGLSIVANHSTTGRVQIDRANLSNALVALDPVIGRGGVFHVLLISLFESTPGGTPLPAR